MLEKSTVVKGLMSKECEWSSITERSTELIPKLVGQNGISVSTMVISVKGSLVFKNVLNISGSPLLSNLVVTLGPLRLRATQYPSAAPQVSSSASLRRAAWPGATLT